MPVIAFPVNSSEPVVVAPLQEALLNDDEVLSDLTRVFLKGMYNILSGT